MGHKAGIEHDMPALLTRVGPIAARLLRRPTSSVVDAGDLLAHAATTSLNPGTLLAEAEPDEPPAAATDTSSESGYGSSSRLS